MQRIEKRKTGKQEKRGGKEKREEKRVRDHKSDNSITVTLS